MTVFQVLNDSSLFQVLYSLGKIPPILTMLFKILIKAFPSHSLSAKHAIDGNTPFKCSVQRKTQHFGLEWNTVSPLPHNSGTTSLPQILPAPHTPPAQCQGMRR